MAISIRDIDVDSILIKPPKKYDESYICKINYSNGEEKTKFVISFDDANIQAVKSNNYMYVKVSNTSYKHMLKIQDKIISTTKNSVEKWFNHKMHQHTIEDSFVSNVIYHEKYGKTLKIKTSNDVESDISKKNGNLVLRLACVKFLKASYSLIWEYESFHETQSTCMFHNDSDDEDGHDDTVCDAFDIDEDVICEIRKNIMDNASDKVLGLRNIIDKAIHDINVLNSYIEKVSNDLSLNIVDLDRISRDIDAINVENIF